MPPTSPPEELSYEGLPIPSDEDIHVLEEIIQSAEEHQAIGASPFRAIFSGYNQVLAERGIRTEDDGLYFRFVFKLGEVWRQDSSQPLHKILQEFLAQFGILVEYGYEDDTTSIRRPDSAINEEGQETTALTSPQRRSRRASFSSFISHEEETTREKTRPSSRASLSQLDDYQTKGETEDNLSDRQFPLRNPGNWLPTRTRSESRKENFPPLAPGQRRLGPLRTLPPNACKTVTTVSGPSQEFTEGLERHRSRNGGGRLEERPSRNANIISADDLVAAASSMLQSSETSVLREVETDPTVTLDLDTLPQQDHRERDADTYDYFRLRRIARKALYKWRRIASTRRHNRQLLEQKAIAHDHTLLQGKMLLHWHSSSKTNQQGRETERFYERLGVKAARARDLYILTKAFTHWAQCTVEEQARASVARRHIIRLRYFNAWKEITAVNEFKVRRFCLNKIFTLWKQKFAATLVFNDRAVTLYQENLVETNYWRWFWNFCGQRAPQYRAIRLKQQGLQRWVDATRACLEQGDRPEAWREDRMKRRSFNTWLKKLRAQKQQQTDAEQYHRRQMVSRALPAWQLQLAHAPIARQVSGIVESRIKRSAFERLKHWMELEYHGKEYNRLRTLCNAWVTWNDELRLRTFRQRTGDRVLVDMLYKWVLAERTVLLQRLNQERLQERILAKLQARVQASSRETQRQTAIALGFRRRKLKSYALAKLRAVVQSRNDQVHEALTFRAPRILRPNLHVWYAKHQHLAHIGRMCTEATFFLRTHRSLQAWTTATNQSQKQKIKDSYSRMRRVVKMNLAREMLRRWHTKMTGNVPMHTLANNTSTERVQSLVRDLLLHWHNRLTASQTLSTIAVEHHRDFLLTSTLHTWQAQHASLGNMRARSTSFAASAVEKTAYDALRKLQLRALDLRAVAAKGERVQSWAARGRVRAFFRLWADRTAQKRSPSTASPAPLSVARSARSARARRVLEASRSAVATTREGGSGTANVESEQSSSSPLARAGAQGSSNLLASGLLRTPSRRAARARELVDGSRTAESTTPATIGRGTEAREIAEASTPSGPSSSRDALSTAPSGTGAAKNDSELRPPPQTPQPRQFETPLMRRLFRRRGEQEQGHTALTEGRFRPGTEPLGTGSSAPASTLLGTSLPAPGLLAGASNSAVDLGRSIPPRPSRREAQSSRSDTDLGRTFTPPRGTERPRSLFEHEDGDDLLGFGDNEG